MIEAGTLVMMLIFLGFVWGGFLFTLRLAMKKNDEKKKLTKETNG